MRYLANLSLADEYFFAHCPTLACVCYISLFELAMIFIMDVVVWEVLKWMFKKEIAQAKAYFEGRFIKPPS